MSLRKIYYQLPISWRFLARRIAYAPQDLLHTLSGSRSKYEPPKGLIYTGRGLGSFLEQGQQHFKLLQKHLPFEKDASILDVGSGIGRTAIPLSKYLSPEGRYEGFDPVKIGIDWCQSKITPDFPNFNFTYTPLKNDLYTDHEVEAASFTFPYEDNTFDRVFLFSIFTHFSVAEISHYLFEIQRVLRPGGRCLATFFVYNQKIEAQISTQEAFNFPVDKGDYRLMDEAVESANIALREALLQSLIQQAQLKQVKYLKGFWKPPYQKTEDNDFQDIVVVEK